MGLIRNDKSNETVLRRYFERRIISQSINAISTFFLENVFDGFLLNRGPLSPLEICIGSGTSDQHEAINSGISEKSENLIREEDGVAKWLMKAIGAIFLIIHMWQIHASRRFGFAMAMVFRSPRLVVTWPRRSKYDVCLEADVQIKGNKDIACGT